MQISSRISRNLRPLEMDADLQALIESLWNGVECSGVEWHPDLLPPGKNPRKVRRTALHCKP